MRCAASNICVFFVESVRGAAAAACTMTITSQYTLDGGSLAQSVFCEVMVSVWCTMKRSAVPMRQHTQGHRVNETKWGTCC